MKIKKSLVFIFLIIAYVGFYLYSSVMNYYGYCSRTGHRLSDEQRLNIAISHYLLNQKIIDSVEVFQYKGSRGSFKRYPLKEYISSEDFLEKNPKCCQLGYGGVDVPLVDFWVRARGVGNGYFIFHHKINYINNSEVDEEIESKYTHYFVDNCGVPRYRILTP